MKLLKNRLVAGVFFVAVALCFYFSAGLAAAEDTVKLTKPAGKVEIKLAGAENWQEVSSPVSIAQGSKIRTGADGTAFLVWRNGHTVKLHPLSMMAITKLSTPVSGAENTELSLTKGKAFARVNKLAAGSSTFEVRTPTAIAGVRGTSWETALVPSENPSEPPVTILCVVEGDISFESGGIEIIVEEGFQSLCSGGAPSTPEHIPAEHMGSLQADNHDAEQTSEEESKTEKEIKRDAKKEVKEEKAGERKTADSTGGEDKASVEEPSVESPAVSEEPDVAAAEDVVDVVDQIMDDNLTSEIINETMKTGTVDVIIHLHGD